MQQKQQIVEKTWDSVIHILGLLCKIGMETIIEGIK